MQSTPARRYQQLQPENRVTLTSLLQQKYSARYGPGPGAISKHHQSRVAPQHTARRLRQHLGMYLRTTATPAEAPAELNRDGILFGLMCHFLSER